MCFVSMATDYSKGTFMKFYQKLCYLFLSSCDCASLEYLNLKLALFNFFQTFSIGGGSEPYSFPLDGGGCYPTPTPFDFFLV